jgi:CubicO group peptidase (beta-lactamase class C family)
MDNQFKAQHAQIARFQSLSGAPALSLGVFQQGKIIHTAHFGRKDCSEPDSPDDDSIYYAGSMLKILTVCMVAKLVHDGVLEWDVPIREYLPSFNRDDDVGRLTTVRDLISNRTGLAGAAFYWYQQNGELLLRKDELVRMACHIKAVKPFRSTFLYSQWNYVLLQLVLETLTGKLFSQIMHESIISPLGLRNTTFGIPSGENMVAAHAARENGTATKIKTNPWTDESGITAGAGGKVSLKDMLTIYIDLLKSYNDQVAHDRDFTPGSPLVCLRTIFEPQILAHSSQFSNQHYCLGLYRTILPGNLSISSWNMPLFGNKAPPFGKTLAGVEVYHHTMGIPGYLGSMFLVPQSKSGVVVLTNATPRLDATDLTAQCLLGVLLGEPRPHLLRMAEMAPKISQGIFKHIATTIEEGRTQKPPSLPLEMFSGIYTNSSKTFFLHITVLSHGLRINVQNNSRVTYDLQLYNGDTFFWPVNRDVELCNKSMWPLLLPDFHIVGFLVDKKNVRGLKWHHDPSAGPEDFIKDTTRSTL